jgi:hypothetical protein
MKLMLMFIDVDLLGDEQEFEDAPVIKGLHAFPEQKYLNQVFTEFFQNNEVSTYSNKLIQIMRNHQSRLKLWYLKEEASLDCFPQVAPFLNIKDSVCFDLGVKMRKSNYNDIIKDLKVVELHFYIQLSMWISMHLMDEFWHS